MNIFLNAVFGDGCVSWDRRNKKGLVPIYFSGTNESLVIYKQKLLGSNSTKKKEQHKDAWGKKPIYITHSTILPTPGTKLELISKLEYEDFLLWLLDDGSYHKKRGFLNLNSHALTLAENIELSFHLWHYLGVESRILPDKKKDGRLFFYLYIPGAQYDGIKPDLKQFMIANNITGMGYKVGEDF